MSIWKRATLGVLIPLALTTPVLAQDTRMPEGPGAMFGTLDIDGDGMLTLEEMQAMGAVRFAAADLNGDGALSRDEMIAAAQGRIEARVTRMITRADADGDGLLSQDELASLREGRRGPNPDRMFDRMDANDDGAVTEDEFRQAATRFMDRRGHGPRHGGHRG